MGKLQSFTVEIDDNGVFYGPSVRYVSGKVQLNLASEMKLKSIEVSLYGSAKAYWEINHGSAEGSNIDVYKDEVVYINSDQLLFDTKQFDKDTLPKGSRSFPFKFELPFNCPPSFEGQNGSIKYGVKAVLRRPWKMDTAAKANLQIVDPPILTKNPSLFTPAATRVIEQLDWRQFGSGEIRLNLSLAKSGFTPGEFVVAECQVSNESSRRLKRLSVRLVQLQICQGKHLSTGEAKSVTTEEVLDEKKSTEEISTGCGRDMQVQLKFNENLIGSTNNCEILRVNYAVIMETESTTPSFTVSATVPVYLGVMGH